MRILYVMNASNFEGIGGMEYHLLDITTWMKAKGVEVGLAVREGTFFQRSILQGTPNVYPLSWTGTGKVRSFFQLKRAIRDFSPDIISINRERDIIRIFFIVKLLGLFSRNKPKIAAVFHNAGGRRLYVLGMLNGILFPTRYMKQEYIPYNRSAEKKSIVIHHGIPLPAIDPAGKLDIARERKFFKGRGFPLIGMIGEMRKNQTELIDVAALLKKKHDHFTIAFIGRGNEDEIAVMKAKIQRLGLTENFIFTGRVDRKAIPDVLFDLDLSVTTNRYEPFGIVHIESMASYTPVVAYNSGGPIEILENGGGVLVEGGAAEMAETLSTLISDHEMRRAMGMTGRSVVEKYFSIDSMGERHYQFYADLLNKQA
jgi:glycosyltransferase involved in cell wall biosynthesis